jgi:hypothetical protein
MFACVTVAGTSLALAGAMAAYPAGAAVAPPVLGHWAQAAPVPGLSALTKDQQHGLRRVVCPVR